MGDPVLAFLRSWSRGGLGEETLDIVKDGLVVPKQGSICPRHAGLTVQKEQLDGVNIDSAIIKIDGDLEAVE